MRLWPVIIVEPLATTERSVPSIFEHRLRIAVNPKAAMLRYAIYLHLIFVRAAARLHTRNNPDFFNSTVVEQSVAMSLD
jgi:hypothetical protein